MTIKCHLCKKRQSAMKILEHLRVVHDQNPDDKPDQTKTIRLVEKNVKEVVKNEKFTTVQYEVMQNGQLVVVDGIHYFVRNGVTFMDCPMCVNKSMAMTLLPEHIRDFHHLE